MTEPSNQGKILIIDDHPMNLNFLANLLRQHGYQVQRAISGKLGLNAAFASPPDLILLDIIMPEMDGYEVCSKLRNDPKTQLIPIIFISIMDEVDEKVKSFQYGAVDYIIKPFQTEEVLARINNQITIQRLQQSLYQKNQELEVQNQQLKAEIKKRKKTEIALQQANSELQKLARLDGLTQLYNRRYFTKYLSEIWQQIIEEDEIISIILCDIDYFKFYNDTYGHIAGDKCLISVATTIKKVIANEGLVARYGGEEFAIILPYINYQKACQIANTIKHKVEQLNIHHQASPINNYVTLSLGVTTGNPAYLDSAESLLHQADQALYEAKNQGRNRLIYYQTMIESAILTNIN